MIHNLKNADCPEIDWAQFAARSVTVVPGVIVFGWYPGSKTVCRVADSLGRSFAHYRQRQKLGATMVLRNEVRLGRDDRPREIGEIALRIIREATEAEALEAYSRRMHDYGLLWPTGGYWYEVHAD